MDFLSAEWVAALDAAAATVVAPAGSDQILQYNIDAFDYYVTIKGGHVRFEVGRADQPTVSFRTDRVTAAAIAQGQLSAVSAFMDGRLDVGHDSAALANLQGTLATLGDVAASVRERTRFADA